MSSLKRSDLKQIIKECLLEILSEGLGTQNVQEAISRPRVQGQVLGEQRVPARRGRPSFDPRLDTPIARQQPHQALREAIKREAGGNSVMADLLADTAMTTLQTQISHGDNGTSISPGVSAPGISQQEQFAGTPEEVFGEAAAPRADGSSHWADLAFALPNKKSA